MIIRPLRPVTRLRLAVLEGQVSCQGYIFFHASVSKKA